MHLERFFELNKNAREQKPFNKVRTHEEMKDLAIKAIEANEIDDNSKYFDYVKSFATGETVTNEFGKKLFFKRGK